MNTPLPQTLWPFIWHFVKRYPKSFAVFFIAPMFLILETTLQPYAIKILIDGINEISPGQAKLPTEIFWGIGLFIGAAIVICTICRGQEWLQCRIIPKFLADIRLSVLESLSQQSYGYFIDHLAGNLSNKLSDLPSAIDKIRMFVCWSMVGTIAAGTASVIVVATVSISAAITLFLFISIQGATIVCYARRIDKAAHHNAEDKSTLSGLVVDMIGNILPIKLFARRNFEMQNIGKKQAEERASNRKLMTRINIMRSITDLFYIILAAAFVAIIVKGLQKGAITAGDAAFLLVTMFAIAAQMWHLSQSMTDFFREMGIAKQALALINVPILLQDKKDAKPLNVTKGEIIFKNVHFQYHHETALFSDKNVVIAPGEKVGLVGFSGSGKTTFVQLIMRFFDIKSGEILIDGQNIADVTQESLRENIVMVPQDTTLFHRTLMENIRYGDPNATDAEVIAAAKAAHCDEFITELPHGYNTLVGERGVKLSGGQRQRIAIARAILKQAPILIMDEATSALDSVTEQTIQSSISQLMAQRTTIVVAHRLSTLTAMDRILVFDQGHIKEDGTHEALLAADGLYAQMWKMQAGGFLPVHKQS
jgi:ATP-binding cassette subfamily B protein